MQEVTLELKVQYRSDGPTSKAQVKDAVCELLLSVSREELFKNKATYAGYGVAIK